MLSTFLIVLPVFALILTGWTVRRMGVFGPQSSGELNRFVVYLALPALLFSITARASLAEIWQPGFIASFGLGCLLVFAVTLAVGWRRSGHIADAAIDALGGSYANTGYIGFPLALAVFGPSAMPAVLMASIITVCAVFALGIVLIEAGLRTELSPARLIGRTSAALAKNPLLVAPLLGSFFPLTGIPLPGAADRFLHLLGDAAPPCALVGLGLFLGEKRAVPSGGAGSGNGAVALMIGLKLLLQPLATWVLATHVFRLPPSLSQPAVLLAALPTGTGPFMLAEFYQREAATTARVIIGSTLLSVLTLTVYLMMKN